MLPSNTVRDWSNCADADAFMDRVLNATGKPPSSGNSTDDKLKQVAKTSFEDKVRTTYEQVAKYLEENCTEKNSSIPTLQRIAENIERVRLYAGSETPALKEAREKVEKIINSLQINSLLEKLKVDQKEILQYSYIPFIQSELNELISLYNKMMKEDRNTQTITITKINNKLLNLNKLVAFIKSLSTGLGQAPISQAALSQLTTNDFKSLSIIQPYLSGERELKADQELEEIKGQIFKIVKKIEDSLTLSPSALKQKRLESPISSTAIHKQAELHKTRREVQAWTNKQDQLQPLGSSVNQVFQLKKANGSEIVAFYKESPDKGENAELMEELMWDSAVVMGLEDQFVATSSTTLRTKEHFEAANESVKTWNDNRSELVEKPVSGARKGGIQSAQEGVTLEMYKQNTDPNKTPIQRNQLVRGVLASSLMGFFDAHSGNIIIDSEGNIKFFDNASSMPHSNGCFLWGGNTLKSSFRCGLLTLMDTQMTLSPQDRQLIQAEVEKYKIKYQELKKFYENPSTKAKINKLPGGWFNTEQVLEAMQERIQRLEVAAANPKITKLCDLALASQPNLKFHQAMSIIFAFADKLPRIFTHDYLKYMGELGYHSIDACIYKCSEIGIDPIVVKQWCEDPDLNFNLLIKKIVTYKERIDKEEARRHADELIQQLKSTALPDFKDTQVKKNTVYIEVD